MSKIICREDTRSYIVVVLNAFFVTIKKVAVGSFSFGVDIPRFLLLSAIRYQVSAIRYLSVKNRLLVPSYHSNMVFDNFYQSYPIHSRCGVRLRRND